MAVGGVAQYVQWAAGRTYFHIEASRTLGRLLPPGTLVHGKLANGLALDNQIRPVFVGREFGNYADRLARNDVAFILTYVAPRTGYEGPVILDVIDAYPERRVLWTFAVAETPGGRDRAALIEKGPPARPGVWFHRSGIRRRVRQVRLGWRRPRRDTDQTVRTIDNAAIKAHADRRFRSDTTTRSSSTSAAPRSSPFWTQSGVGRPAACSTPAAAAAACRCRSPRKPRVVGIDLVDRFRDAGTRLADEKSLANLEFLQADGRRCRLRRRAFDAVLSHAVIEHVADASAIS